MEHVSLEQNLALMRRLPVGSRLIIQTPYTESVLGHRFYMNVPSHVAPYSPWVIKKMLRRFGYQVVSDGSVDWAHPSTWKNKIRAFLLLKVMGVDPDLFLGGGNYFVVADRGPGCLGLTLVSDYPPNHASRDRLIQCFVSPLVDADFIGAACRRERRSAASEPSFGAGTLDDARFRTVRAMNPILNELIRSGAAVSQSGKTHTVHSPYSDRRGILPGIDYFRS